MALIRKLCRLSSAHEAELLRREVVVTGRAKSGSEDVCRNVDTLHGGHRREQPHHVPLF